VTGTLTDIFSGYLDLRWHLHPVEATARGQHEYDDTYPRYDPASIREHIAALRSYTAVLEEVPAHTLDDEIDRTAVLHDARHLLLVFERERPFTINPALHLSQALNGISLLLAGNADDPPRRAKALAARLAALPEFLRQATEVLTEPCRPLIGLASAMLPDGLALLREHLDDPSVDLSAVDAPELAAARDGAVDALLAFGDALALMEERARDNFAIGRDLFDRKLHTAHMIRENADELLRYGEHLRADATAAVERIAHDIRPGADWRELAAELGDAMMVEGTLPEDVPGPEPLVVLANRLRRPVRRVIATPEARDGWELYRESLLVERGIADSPGARLLEARDLLWRAVCIILDVSLHTKGMRVDTAAEHLRDEVGFDAATAAAHVVRYCASPTVPLCAAVGRREILRLRDDARRARGGTFSLGEFHHELLGYGALPTALARWGMGLA
jgi:uncharacterized protein (DUF885 family)